MYIRARITKKMLLEIDALIVNRCYANRSEFIHNAIREKLCAIKSKKIEVAIKKDVAWGLYGHSILP